MTTLHVSRHFQKLALDKRDNSATMISWQLARVQFLFNPTELTAAVNTVLIVVKNISGFQRTVSLLIDSGHRRLSRAAAILSSA